MSKAVLLGNQYGPVCKVSHECGDDDTLLTILPRYRTRNPLPRPVNKQTIITARRDGHKTRTVARWLPVICQSHASQKRKRADSAIRRFLPIRFWLAWLFCFPGFHCVPIVVGTVAAGHALTADKTGRAN